jgi:hypothetical protein
VEPIEAVIDKLILIFFGGILQNKDTKEYRIIERQISMDKPNGKSFVFLLNFAFVSLSIYVPVSNLAFTSAFFTSMLFFSTVFQTWCGAMTFISKRKKNKLFYHFHPV